MSGIKRTISLFVFVACTSFDCTTFSIAIHDAPGEGNHYVVIKESGGTDEIYDCYSKPYNGAWAPECREVKRVKLEEWNK
jgi:hypothetical protein